MKRMSSKKIMALLFPLLPLAFISQPAHALKCAGYVTFGDGTTMCAGYVETSPCEGADQRCIPIPPPPRPAHPADGGGTPPRGPSPGDGPLAPDEMSCKQVNQQIDEQKKIISSLNATIQMVTGDIATAELSLSDSLSETAVNVADAESEAACVAWRDLFAANPDMYFCPEPANNKPIKPRCRWRKLTPSEQATKDSCDVKGARYFSLSKSRTKLLEVERTARATLASAERKKAIATNNLKKLRDAKDAKANCP